MRRPSSRMRNQRVTLLQHVWAKDPDGGRTIAATRTTAGVACSVEPGEPETRVDDTGRWTTEVPHVLRFSDDPGLKAHDEVTWVEGSRTHHLVVQGTANRMGRGVTFEVATMERI